MVSLITGAYSFSGKAIVNELLKKDETIKTITNHPDPSISFYNKIETYKYNFEDFDGLVQIFKGVDTFYNAYWIRYPFNGVTFLDAIQNSNILFQTGKNAGVIKDYSTFCEELQK